MAKSASADELRNMRSQATDQMKMTIFYRYWVNLILKVKIYYLFFKCLKEAVLKATGHGIVDDLSRYDFSIDKNERYRPGKFFYLK